IDTLYEDEFDVENDGNFILNLEVEFDISSGIKQTKTEQNKIEILESHHYKYL
ncbi:18349_t:CDS:2, partial [Gigaspora margarita]